MNDNKLIKQYLKEIKDLNKLIDKMSSIIISDKYKSYDDRLLILEKVMKNSNKRRIK